MGYMDEPTEVDIDRFARMVGLCDEAGAKIAYISQRDVSWADIPFLRDFLLMTGIRLGALCREAPDGLCETLFPGAPWETVATLERIDPARADGAFCRQAFEVSLPELKRNLLENERVMERYERLYDEGLIETREIQSNPYLMAKIERGLAQSARGELQTNDLMEP